MGKENLEKIKLKALEFVNERFKAYNENRSDLEQKWTKYNKLYHSLESENQKYNGTAKYVTPDTATATKTAITFCDTVLFGSKPFFRINGVGGKNDNAKAELNTIILNLQQEKIRFRSQVKKFLRKLCMYGVAVAKVSYERKEKYVIKKLQERKGLLNSIKNLFVEPETIEKNKVPIYDNIKFTPLSIFNIFWDIYCEWDEQEAIIEKLPNVSASTLRVWARQDNSPYFGIEDYLDINESGIASESKSDKNPHLVDVVGATDQMKNTKEKHEILECWCNFDIDGDGIDEECIITVIDQKEVIRMEANPYDIQEKPYVFAAWEPVDEAESSGMGIPQLAEKAQEGLNDIYNQFFDDMNMILDCMMVVDDTAGIKNSSLKSKPRGIIHVSGNPRESIVFVRPPDITSAAFKGMSILKDDIKQSTGSTATLQGLPARYDTSATEAAQMNSSSQKEIFSKLRSIEDSVIKPYLRKAYSYNMQFMSTEDIMKIVGSEAFGIFLEKQNIKVIDKDYSISNVLLSDFDFIPLSVTEIENKVVKGQQLMNLYNMSLKSPNGIWNVKNIAKKIVDVLGDGDKSLLADDFDMKLVSPENENILMGQGESPRAKMQDMHEKHIDVHSTLEIPPEYEQIRKEHIEEHIKMLSVQAQIAQQKAILEHLNSQTEFMNKISQKGVPQQEQGVYSPGTITPGQAGQVPGLSNPPAEMGGTTGQITE